MAFNLLSQQKYTHINSTADWLLGRKKETNKNMSKSDNSIEGPVIYNFWVNGLDGKTFQLKQYKGKVLLVVNTASHCGFTPQYEELEQLHEKYFGDGLIVLGSPCNQFGQQEPNGNSDIAAFCEKNYGIKFKIAEKIEVNGKSEHPLFTYLKKQAAGAWGLEVIKWNFTKFLVNRDGTVFKRYAPDVSPSEIIPDIEAALAKV